MLFLQQLSAISLFAIAASDDSIPAKASSLAQHRHLAHHPHAHPHPGHPSQRHVYAAPAVHVSLPPPNSTRTSRHQEATALGRCFAFNYSTPGTHARVTAESVCRGISAQAVAAAVRASSGSKAKYFQLLRAATKSHVTETSLMASNTRLHLLGKSPRVLFIGDSIVREISEAYGRLLHGTPAATKFEYIELNSWDPAPLAVEDSSVPALAEQPSPGAEQPPPRRRRQQRRRRRLLHARGGGGGSESVGRVARHPNPYPATLQGLLKHVDKERFDVVFAGGLGLHYLLRLQRMKSTGAMLKPSGPMKLPSGRSAKGGAPYSPAGPSELHRAVVAPHLAGLAQVAQAATAARLELKRERREDKGGGREEVVAKEEEVKGRASSALASSAVSIVFVGTMPVDAATPHLSPPKRDWNDFFDFSLAAIWDGVEADEVAKLQNRWSHRVRARKRGPAMTANSSRLELGAASPQALLFFRPAFLAEECPGIRCDGIHFGSYDKESNCLPSPALWDGALAEFLTTSFPPPPHPC